MNFLALSLACSYHPDAKPECYTTQEMFNVTEAQEFINKHTGVSSPMSAQDYRLNDTVIFKDHVPEKHILKKYILIRVE
jgi:hypothetical protein